MAAPRASSFKALRNLQKASNSTPAKRCLHITGANSSPHPYEAVPRHSYKPLSLQDLRNECRKRSLAPTGTKHELIDRLAGHDSLQARAFSIAMKRIVGEQARKPFASSSPAEKSPVRHFNTSRTLKTVGDSSTIDFAYLPSLFDSSLDPQPTAIRVPILPHIESDDAQAVLESHSVDVAAGGVEDSIESTVMKPEIVTVTETLADGAHVDLDLNAHPSSMSEVMDNHATEIALDSLMNLSETVGKSARKLVDSMDEGTISRVWTGFLDDLLGEKRSRGPKMA